jgi:anti-anti-sigma factor
MGYEITLEEIDQGNIDAFRAQVDQALADPVDGVAVLDLHRVTYMGSAGIRVLLEGHARSAEGGPRIVVVDAQPIVRRLFEITGFGDLLEPHPDQHR